MVNRNLIFMISAILFIANSALAMEKKEEEPLDRSNASLGRLTPLIEKKKLSVEPLDLSILPTEKPTEPSLKRKVSKTLPLVRRRKSSGSPRVRVINSPDSSSQDESKESPGRLATLSPEEKKISPRCMITTAQEGKEQSPRPGFKRYSLVGPIEYKQIPFPNSFQDEQEVFPGREGAISPMRQSREPVL